SDGSGQPARRRFSSSAVGAKSRLDAATSVSASLAVGCEDCAARDRRPARLTRLVASGKCEVCFAIPLVFHLVFSCRDIRVIGCIKIRARRKSHATRRMTDGGKTCVENEALVAAGAASGLSDPAAASDSRCTLPGELRRL